VQCDEIWAYCYSKEKNVPYELKNTLGFGDVWTFTAIDADSKLAISWLMGNRDFFTAEAFMNDVHARISNRVQLTTDGFKPYFVAVKNAFGTEIDYAALRKIYGNESWIN
jgi:transposase-like protein